MFFLFFSLFNPFSYFSRKAGIVFCTAQGMSGQNVRALSKHKQDVSELSISVVNVIAGFLPNNQCDKYFVPRASVGLPGEFNPDQLAHLLFPKLASWRAAAWGLKGDKSKATNRFLYSVITYSSEVVVQDGVLWIKYHPGNPAVVELQQKMDGRSGAGNYCAWVARKSTSKRDDLNIKLATTISQVESLNI